MMVCLMASGAGAAMADEPNPSFNLVNRGRVAIREIYATTAGQTTWGLDRLQHGTVPANMNVPIRLPIGSCVYDIRVVYDNGQSEEQRHVDTCATDNVTFPRSRSRAATRAPVAGDDPSFRLVNRGRSEVNELYVSPPDEDHWGDDRLGDATVAPGRTKVIDLPPGPCFYDLRIVYANGEATEKRRVNLCITTDLRVP